MEEATFSPLKWELRGKQKETRMIHMVIDQCCSHQNELIFILIYIQMEYTELFLGILMDICQKITHISLFVFSSTEWAQKLTPQEQKYTWYQCLCFFLLFVLLCLGWGVCGSSWLCCTPCGISWFPGQDQEQNLGHSSES